MNILGPFMQAYFCRRTALAVLAGVGCSTVWAQTAPAILPISASAATSAPTANQQRVLEDDNVRIEETRKQGQVQRIRVQSKLAGVRDYDITTSPGGKDLSQNPGTVGKRSWSILDF